MGQIKDYDAKTTPALTDEIVLQETGSGLTKKITNENFLKTIQVEVDTNISDIVALQTNPSLPEGFIYGLTISNDTDTEHDIEVAAGRCKDSTNAYELALASAMTKKIDEAWEVGDDKGGLDTGSVANTTWYYLYLIKKDSDSSIDVLFSASKTSPTMPAGYTYFRRIRGAVLTDGSANILGFTQKDNTFYFNAVILDQDLSNPISITRALITVSVPPDMLGNFAMYMWEGDESYIWVNSVIYTDMAADVDNFDLTASTTATKTIINYNIIVDASSQIAYRSSLANVSVFKIKTKGFEDPAQD